MVASHWTRAPVSQLDSEPFKHEATGGDETHGHTGAAAAGLALATQDSDNVDPTIVLTEVCFLRKLLF